MLLRFSCENFRSVREKQELSLVAAKTRTDEKNESLLETPIDEVFALRCAAIYGSNASGKTNLARAMNTFAAMVSESQRQWQPSGDIPTWNPFALDDLSKAGETQFELEFALDSVVYNYGFRFNAKVISQEWLIDSTKAQRVLFRRHTDGQTVSLAFPNRNLGATSEAARHLDGIKLQTRPNSLFLSSAAQNNHEFLSSIFKWISQSLQAASGSGNWRNRTLESCSEAQRKSQVGALLAFADIGITDFEIVQEEMPEKLQAIQKAILKAIREVEPPPASSIIDDSVTTSRRIIRLLHRGAASKMYKLELDQESAGTRAYFDLLGPVLDRLRDGMCLIVDELEAHLHPLLSRQIVRIFNDPNLNPKGAQLIFTTHDTNLLDLDLLRRDQIWFTEKSEEGATRLVPLSDFRPRKDQDVESAYLHGRFGAVPFIDEGLLLRAILSSSDLEPISDAMSEAK